MTDELKETIENILSDLKNKDGDLFNLCRESFEKFLNKKEISMVQIHRIHKGIVWVKVGSPLVLFTLKFKKHGIIKDIQKKTEKISDVKFYIGE